MHVIDVIGWIGATAFAICAAPQAWQSYKDGHSRGISWGFLGLWTLGELASMVYVIPKGLWPILFNYVGNFLFLLVIIKFKVKERSTA